MNSTNNVQNVILDYIDRINDNCVFLLENIPQKQLNHFISTIGQLEVGETPLVFIDNSSSGSAKEGSLLTDRHIYIKNPSQLARVMAWEEISSASFTLGSPRWLIINEGRFLQIDYIDRSTMPILTEMINDIIDLFPDKNPKTDESKNLSSSREGASPSPTDQMAAVQTANSEATGLPVCPRCESELAWGGRSIKPSSLGCPMGILLDLTKGTWLNLLRRPKCQNCGKISKLEIVAKHGRIPGVFWLWIATAIVGGCFVLVAIFVFLKNASKTR